MRKDTSFSVRFISTWILLASLSTAREIAVRNYKTHLLNCYDDQGNPQPCVSQPFNVPCNCNEIGSFTPHCNNQGQCHCKPGVAGDKCDRCQDNHYDFSQGCKPCNCSDISNIGNESSSDVNENECHCKDKVNEEQCSDCKPSYTHWLWEIILGVVHSFAERLPWYTPDDDAASFMAELGIDPDQFEVQSVSKDSSEFLRLRQLIEADSPPILQDTLPLTGGGTSDFTFSVRLIRAVKLSNLPQCNTTNATNSNFTKKSVMLMHGTKPKYIGSILQNGLRMPPKDRVDLWLGRCIYFTDSSQYAAMYTGSTAARENNVTSEEETFLIIAEGQVGKPKPYRLITPEVQDSDAPPATYDSNKGVGYITRMSQDIQTDEDGTNWHLGTYIKNIRGLVEEDEGLGGSEDPGSFFFDEYCFFSPCLVKIRYLAKIRILPK